MIRSDEYQQIEQARDMAAIELLTLTDKQRRLCRIKELREDIALAATLLEGLE